MIVRIFAVVLFCCCFCTAPSFAQKYLRKAEKQYEIGDFKDAIDGLDKALNKRPDDTEVRARLANAQRITGDLPGANTNYTQLTKDQPDNPDYAFGLAIVNMEQGQYKLAVTQLLKAAELGHPMASVYAKKLEFAQAQNKQSSAWKVSNEFANTRGDDYSPTLFGDNVVYATEREAGAAKLMYSSRDDNNFLSLPTALHKVLTDETNQGPIAYSPSGQLVAITRNNFQSGERMIPEAGWELNLMLSIVGENGDFQAGKAFVHNGPGYNTGFPAFSPEGDKLYFASDRPGGQGGFDLYVSTRTDSGWGVPENLGEEVNTPGNEIAPSAVGSVLYFSSDYLPGMGGMDIYRADLMRNKVTGVVNLGVGVNSPLDDVGFTPTADGQFAYFTSNRAGGKGGLDLYRAMRDGKSLTLAVVDGKTGEPIPMALLDFSDCGQGNYLTGMDGLYSFRAIDAMQCRPKVRKSGYNAKEFSLNAKGLRENQRLEIVLNPEDKISIYEGKVLHSRTGSALSGVSVRAEQIDGPYRSEATSMSDGRYELKLERGAEYTIYYSAPNMSNINREVSSYDADGANILSSFAMFPSASAPAEATSSTRRAMTTGVGSDDDVETPNYTRPSTVTYPITRTTYRSDNPGTVPTGYAVQVAAINQNATDISEYQTKLASIGQVYGKRENGVLRIRVGPYDDRQTAASIQARIRSLGFSDAFVAKESGGTAVGINVAVAQPAPVVVPQTATKSPASPTPTFRPSAPAGASNSTSTYTPPSTPVATEGDYLIRLATYGNFTNFDAQKVAGIGTLTTRQRGEYTVVLLQGFASAAEAEERVLSAQAAGFNDAHVVLEDNEGTLRRVK